MTKNQILQILSSRKGQNIKVTFSRPLKARKGAESIVTKVSSVLVRGGIDYSNLSAVKEARENGEIPSEEESVLPWGTWEIFPYVITHKGQDYIRLYAGTLSNFKPTVQFYIDGKEVTKEAITPLCLASETAEKPEREIKCFTVKAETIVSLG
jgi:hypothetical protein